MICKGCEHPVKIRKLCEIKGLRSVFLIQSLVDYYCYDDINLDNVSLSNFHRGKHKLSKLDKLISDMNEY